ncbi:MAG TPA: DUF2256 domain-containing protein [Gammaproteobacteria bacterium]|nr:DUF2256 domain-containing protein [Gammaproteobacteria bacterium]
MRQRNNLPEKVCVVCLRPFSWRKKWERSWEEVKYCSERCRRNREKNSFLCDQALR